VEALAKVSASADAYDVLGVGPSLTAEVERNTRWESEPAVPVSELYSGVLYDALSYRTLTPGAKRRANNRLVVVSAVWGARSGWPTGYRRTGCPVPHRYPGSDPSPRSGVACSTPSSATRPVTA
jgi:hypothetical protein